MDMTLREDQGDKPGTLNGTSDNGVVVSTDTSAAAGGKGHFCLFVWQSLTAN